MLKIFQLDQSCRVVAKKLGLRWVHDAQTVYRDSLKDPCLDTSHGAASSKVSKSGCLCLC